MVQPDPVMDYVITPHAAVEMHRRGLEESILRLVLASPEQRLQVRSGRDVLQARIAMGSPAKTYLVRVFVDVDRHPAGVVTVYRTSKIDKYWRDQE